MSAFTVVVVVVVVPVVVVVVAFWLAAVSGVVVSVTVFATVLPEVSIFCDYSDCVPVVVFGFEVNW